MSDRRTLTQRLHEEYAFTADLSDEQAKLTADLRSSFLTVALFLADCCPDNRARSLALTNLQQAKMWAVQSVVDG